MSVSSLIDNAQAFANNVTGLAQTASSAAQSALGAIVAPTFSFAAIEIPEYTAPGKIEPFTGLPTVTFDPGVAPSPAALQAISPVDPGTAPILNAQKQPFAAPTKPGQVAQFTQTPPNIDTNIQFPSPPAGLSEVISAPIITSRSAPAKPTYSAPQFNAFRPDDLTAAPTNLPTQFSTAYSEAGPSTVAMVNGYVDAMLAKYNPRYAEQIAAIENQLATYMAGGTGLKPAVENAIYERSRSKADAEARRVRESALKDMAERGFTLPTGALTSAIQQARQAGADTNAAASREIVVMQAEMEQKNLQFAVTTSTALRSTLLNASLSYMQNLVSINGQAIDYAKSVVGMVVETYNIAQKIFAAKLDAYRADAAVFETQLKSALAGVELYKAEIDGFNALLGSDRQQVEVYKARIDTLQTLSNVYKSNIEATVAEASLEKLKLELFQTQVQSYAATVNAKNAEWQAYQAEIAGETAKINVYRAEVDAYQAQVQGFKALIDSKVAAVQAQTAQNTAITQQNIAAQDVFKVTVQQKGEVARTQIATGQLLVQAYEANAQASASNARSYAEYYKAVSSTNIEVSRTGIQAVLSATQIAQANATNIARVASSNAQTYGQLASSALAGMNTLAAELKSE